MANNEIASQLKRLVAKAANTHASAVTLLDHTITHLQFKASVENMRMFSFTPFFEAMDGISEAKWTMHHVIDPSGDYQSCCLQISGKLDGKKIELFVTLPQVG